MLADVDVDVTGPAWARKAMTAAVDRMGRLDVPGTFTNPMGLTRPDRRRTVRHRGSSTQKALLHREPTGRIITRSLIGGHPRRGR